MIRIEGENPLAVLKRTQHHARALIPLVEALSTQLFWSPLNSDDARTHLMIQSRTGANSFGLYLDEYHGRSYHFRGVAEGGNAYDAIYVYDRYMHGDDAPDFILRDRKDCIRFVRSVEAVPLPRRLRAA